MKTKKIISVMAAITSLLIQGTAYCGDEPSYDDTVNLIQKTMAGSTSDARKESYAYIRFDKCNMEYRVLGTYPVGALYDIKFSNIDFSSLNTKMSNRGHDYTAFIALNLNNYFKSKGDFKEMAIRTLVVNVSNDEKAQVLFKAFLHLGELCGAPKSPQ